MVNQYQGNWEFRESIIKNWNSKACGVYYCGYLTSTGLFPLYIGKGSGSEGMRGRLLSHVLENKWPDVTHFGYCLCGSDTEAISWESQEIAKYNPKYNIVGKI